jgi:hypothetical protein
MALLGHDNVLVCCDENYIFLGNFIVTVISFLIYRYPADLFTRAKIESILDWHHTNLRRGAGEIQHYSWLVPLGYSGEIIQ